MADRETKALQSAPPTGSYRPATCDLATIARSAARMLDALRADWKQCDLCGDLGFGDTFTECHPGIGVLCCVHCVEGAKERRLSLCGPYCAPHKELMSKLDAVTAECAELRLRVAHPTSATNIKPAAFDGSPIQFQLSDDDWDLIKEGTKTVIVVLGGTWTMMMRRGDTILVENSANKLLRVKVLGITTYGKNSNPIHEYLREVLESEGLARTLPRARTIEEGIRIFKKNWISSLTGAYGLCAIRVDVEGE